MGHRHSSGPPWCLLHPRRRLRSGRAVHHCAVACRVQSIPLPQSTRSSAVPPDLLMALGLGRTDSITRCPQNRQSTGSVTDSVSLTVGHSCGSERATACRSVCGIEGDSVNGLTGDVWAGPRPDGVGVSRAVGQGHRPARTSGSRVIALPVRRQAWSITPAICRGPRRERWCPVGRSFCMRRHTAYGHVHAQFRVVVARRVGQRHCLPAPLAADGQRDPLRVRHAAPIFPRSGLRSRPSIGPSGNDFVACQTCPHWSPRVVPLLAQGSLLPNRRAPG